ncbi:nuclear transport factor 2 family protein [Parasphingorhabdus sp.]|uniref:nuclear transport factor 2 family protein n=1 Tax=Parasphingorhabdus sp. TaxID=2709688 RepID=UPI003BAF2A68
MDRMDEFFAIEAIKLVKARYCRFLDTKDWDGFASLFVADAAMDVSEDTGNSPINGIEDIVAQVRFAVDNAASSHQVHSPEILVTGPDKATGIWAMQDRVVWMSGKSPIEGVASITGYGQYHERYRLDNGEWRISFLRLSRFHVDMHKA